MYRGAARNTQRFGLKVTAGTAHVEREETVAPVVKQIRFAEMRRLAKIKRIFALERRLKDAVGAEAALLRQELDGIRSGRIEPPLPPKRIAKAKSGPVRQKGDGGTRPAKDAIAAPEAVPPQPPLCRIGQALQSDLRDLATGTVTGPGLVLVKTLLGASPPHALSDLIEIRERTLRAALLHPGFGTSPQLSSKAKAILADLLERRIAALGAG